MAESVRAAAQPAIHPATSDEGRAFLQERIALFAKTAFLLSMFFFIGENVVVIALHGHVSGDTSDGWHLAAASVALVIWLVASKLERLSHRVLIAIDVLGILLSLGCYGMMTANVPDSVVAEHGIDVAVGRMDVYMLFGTFLILMVRAALVPSTMRHTALVSAAGTIPAHVLTFWAFSHFAVGTPPVTPLMGLVSTALWATAAVVVAAFTSRIIYGLQAQVTAVQKLGQYVLDELIGEGGMGSVYRASHALLRRPTAIKLLPPERAGSESLSRFEREVQLTSSLTHPNTVAIFDYGRTPEGIFYYAMEYLEGIDLEQLVARYGPQPAARVVHVLAQVCGSLTEAHAIDLVHRDIKPANIILCERGGVPDVAKVVDFGLVKELSVGKDARVTTADTVVGTPLYLAPEAIKNADAIDGRADLYALGAVGYYLLTGAPVFDGTSVVEICAKHLHEKPIAPSARSAVPIPSDLEKLVLRCLEKNPEARPASSSAMREALLACAVEAWTEREARAWWSEHGDALPPPSIASAHGALTIDLHSRMPPVARAE